MDSASLADACENFDPETSASGQLLPPLAGPDEGGLSDPAGDDGVERLREDVRKLAEDVATIDRRDATQHGLLKGEIAHLVRRITRLEALPKTRPSR